MILIGTYVKWNDPAINDYDVEDREEQLNKIYKVIDFYGYEDEEDEIVLIQSEEGNEIEAYLSELVELQDDDVSCPICGSTQIFEGEDCYSAQCYNCGYEFLP